MLSAVYWLGTCHRPRHSPRMLSTRVIRGGLIREMIAVAPSSVCALTPIVWRRPSAVRAIMLATRYVMAASGASSQTRESPKRNQSKYARYHLAGCRPWLVLSRWKRTSRPCLFIFNLHPVAAHLASAPISSPDKSAKMLGPGAAILSRREELSSSLNALSGEIALRRRKYGSPCS